MVHTKLRVTDCIEWGPEPRGEKEGERDGVHGFKTEK